MSATAFVAAGKAYIALGRENGEVVGRGRGRRSWRAEEERQIREREELEDEVGLRTRSAEISRGRDSALTMARDLRWATTGQSKA